MKHRTSIRSLLAGAFSLLAVALVVWGFLTPHGAQAKSVTWRNYDVTLDLNEDGSFHVTELQTVDFAGGPFTYAFATIPTSRMDDLRNVRVSEILDGATVPYQRSTSEDDETWQIKSSSTDVNITWYMPSNRNQERVFQLEYDVIGGLRVYDSDSGPRQQIWWTAIASDVTEIAPIENATFTINLPAAVDMATVVIDGPGGNDPAAHSTDGRTWTWQREGMSSGDDLTARLEFPALVNATTPAWQAADDDKREREAEADSRQAALRLLLAAAGLLAFTAGGAGLIGLWYVKGRDPGVGKIATYLSEPPDDLPPGAAGALVDEVVNERDIVATMVDLGNKGAIKIVQKEQADIFGRPGYVLEKQPGEVELRPFEATFLKALMGTSESVDLVTAKARFGPQSERIKREMYQELVTRGYFPVSPETTRSRYRRVAGIGIVAIVAAFALLSSKLFAWSGWIILPGAAFLAICLALWILSQFMPKKSYAGAEQSAKWRAFRTYLDEIDDNKQTDESRAIFQKYLPYAVAFGIEQSWVNRFAAAGAPAPTWFEGQEGGMGQGWGNMGRHRRSGWGGGTIWTTGTGTGSSGGSSGGSGGPDFP
ncbi:MAG TPA: DUF2207 domain-containing protein, partial [Thermomicrobiales bacterium]|nr:DUF2207 domain-containing protein [Thermomicrobiales bacterium]